MSRIESPRFRPTLQVPCDHLPVEPRAPERPAIEHDRGDAVLVKRLELNGPPALQLGYDDDAIRSPDREQDARHIDIDASEPFGHGMIIYADTANAQIPDSES